MGRVDAGRIAGSGRVVFRTTVHGPVTGYGKVERPHGRALAQARELRARHPVAARVPGADGRHGALGRDVPGGDGELAVHVQHRLRRRPRHRDVLGRAAAGAPPARRPAVPDQGHGRVRVARLPRAVASTRTRRTRRAGCWSTGTTARRRAGARPTTTGSTAPPSACGCCSTNLAKRDKHDLATVTGAMNAAATQDLRSRRADAGAAVGCCARAPAPSPRAARMLELLVAWRAAGSSRLDRDLDGVMDAGPGPGDLGRVLPAAVRRGDAGPARARRHRRAPTPARAAASPTAASGTSTRTCGGSTASGSRRPFKRRYCGDGNRAACARAIWAALEAVPGDPDALRADATQGADRLPARAAADDDPLHEPPERHPAGDLVRPAPASVRPVPVRELREDVLHDAVDEAAPRRSAAAVLAHGAVDEHVLAAPLEVEVERVRAADRHREWRSGSATTTTAPSPLPTRRAVLTNVPDALLNAIDRDRVLDAGRGGLVVARRGERAERADASASVCGAPGALSLTCERGAERRRLRRRRRRTCRAGGPCRCPSGSWRRACPPPDDSDAPL